jgi:hypothetical protein
LCLRMLETMRAYHEAGYVHGDIKCANWCFKDATDSTLQVQLIDYGVRLLASCSERPQVSLYTSVIVACCSLQALPPAQSIEVRTLPTPRVHLWAQPTMHPRACYNARCLHMLMILVCPTQLHITEQALRLVQQELILVCNAPMRPQLNNCGHTCTRHLTNIQWRHDDMQSRFCIAFWRCCLAIYPGASSRRRQRKCCRHVPARSRTAAKSH